MHLITSTTILGVGLDAWIIVIILTIPIFFIWRWIFKKFIQTKLKRRIITWLVTIVSAPFIYATIIFLWILSVEYYPKNHFDKQKWINDKDERYELSDDIINSKMLIGKTKFEIKALLGDEGNKTGDNEWYYDLGFRPELTGIDPDNLEIDFKNGKVLMLNNTSTDR